ncbi:MAG: phospholipase D family protein [Nitrososphaeria archaeon]
MKSNFKLITAILIILITGILVGSGLYQLGVNTTTLISTTTLTSVYTITETQTCQPTTTIPIKGKEVIGIYFSPKGGAADQIISWISKANFSVHILIYSFTLDEVGDALVLAKNNGVDVKVVFEKSQVSQYSEYFKLKNAGVEVRNDTNPDLMHDKVAIIDGYIVITGSYNWSSSAENSNNENMVIIKSKEVADEYERAFQQIWVYGR